jgi:ParB/RepB/Spo0J family partition protein
MAINLKNLNRRINDVTVSGEKLTTLAHSEEVNAGYIVPAQNNICAKNDTAASIQELADSIAANGLIHDLTVNKISETEYHLISGERRFRAVTEILQWKTIPCRVYEHMSDDNAQLMLLEANLQVRHYSDGELLDFYKEAEAIIERMQVKAPQQALAALLGKSTRQIRKYQAISETLSQDEQKAIANGTMSLNTGAQLAQQRKNEKKVAVPQKKSAKKKSEPVPQKELDRNGDEPLPNQVSFDGDTKEISAAFEETAEELHQDVDFQQSGNIHSEESNSSENIISCLQRDLSDEIQQAKERKENCTDALEKASANGALGALLLVEAHLNKLINGKEKKQNDKR